jgi:hypothetical protein
VFSENNIFSAGRAKRGDVRVFPIAAEKVDE